MFGSGDKTQLPDAARALPGRAAPLPVAERHAVLGTPLDGALADNQEQALFGLGCFWGAERLFWRLPGVFTTAAGYAGGHTPNPTYREVCSGQTGHAEVVRVVFDPAKLPFERLLETFFEGHNPTQGMRQGNDRGTQYRSAIYTTTAAQMQAAEAAKARYQAKLDQAGYAAITTEIAADRVFYYAEDFHQQYLEKNPGGYCGLGGTGVRLASGA